MKKLTLVVTVPATIGLMALSSEALADTTVTSFENSASTTPGVWYELDVRLGGTASVVDLSGYGGDLENNQPSPGGAAKITTDLTNAAKAEVGVGNDYGTVADILAALQVSYSWHKASNAGQNLYAAPALKLTFHNPSCTDATNNPLLDCYGTLIYEPYWNPSIHLPAVDTWVTAAMDYTNGLWWWTGGFGSPNQSGGPPLQTLAQWETQLSGLSSDFQGASLVLVSVAVGTYNQGQVGYFDNVTISGTNADASYDFNLDAAANFFTLAILPDTQMYVEQHPEILEAQMDWIIANQQDENIIYVSHLGDIKDDRFCDNKTVNNGTGGGRTEWEIVNDAFTKLDLADIAYGVLPGNHDFEQISNTCPTDYNCATGESETCAQRPLGVDDTSNSTFNSVLGPSRFDDVLAPGYQTTYGDLTGVGVSMTPQAGNRRAGTNEDNFSLVDFGGVGLVIINLGYREDTNALASGESSVCASTTNPEISWADDLLSEYPDRLGIVTSHYFLEEQNRDPGRNLFIDYGASVYTCLADNPNFLMMLSAHRWGEAWRREITGRNADLPVHALLSDYQQVNYLLSGGGVPSTAADFHNLDDGNSFGDSGFMRLMRFDLNTGVVTTTTFTPEVSFADPVTGTPLTYPDDSAGDHDNHWHVGLGSGDSRLRPGLVSVFEPDIPVNSSTGRIRFTAGAGLNEDTASNFCFTYRGYRIGVTEPPPDGVACPITFFDP